MNQNDLVADDIFAMKVAKTAKVTEEIVDSSKNIPIGFIPVNFACKDKLSKPILHFRNYSMEELLELASTNETNQFSTLIKKVLNKMVYEKIDCATLHPEQIKQILLTIYLNFWGKSLLQVPYFVDDDSQEVAYTDIDINNLTIKDIDDRFKEPFSITDDNGLKVKFILPRVSHVFTTDTFIKEFYREQENKFAKVKKLKALIEKIENSDDENIRAQLSKITVTEEEDQEYEEFINEKGKMYFCVLESQLIHSINGVELKTLEEKIDAFKTKIPIDFWFQYKDNVQKFGSFGIDSNYTFTREDGTKLTRGFSFRLTDFIPSVEQKTDRKYTVQFDD